MARNFDEHRDVSHDDFDDSYRFDDTRHDVVEDQGPERTHRPARRTGEARDEATAIAALYGSTRRSGTVHAFPQRRPSSLDLDDLGGDAA